MAVESPSDSIPFRYNTDDSEQRSLDEIAMPELIGFSTGANIPAIDLARENGIPHLACKAREQLEYAVAWRHNEIQDSLDILIQYRTLTSPT